MIVHKKEQICSKGIFRGIGSASRKPKVRFLILLGLVIKGKIRQINSGVGLRIYRVADTFKIEWISVVYSQA